jgi:hypothetical protein
VANHRLPKKRRARKAVLAAVAAAGISSALVLGHATNTTAANLAVQLTNTVIGAGGLGDTTGVRVPDKLNGTVVPPGYDYFGSPYPAALTLAASRDAGVPVMHLAITSRGAEPSLIVVAYSEGTLVAEQERRNLQTLAPASAPSPAQLSFVQIASPFAPNGGIYGRFPGFGIPVITDAMGAAVPTRYDTTYYAEEYDPYADFPAYFNPLALLNTALAVRYSHPDEVYDAIVPGTTPVAVTKVVNSAGGTDTYVLVYAQHLPLLAPVRELAGMVFLTPLTEPVLSAFEPLLRVLIDMSYTDRINANPATATPFSLITPPGKILEALGAVPGALAQGAGNLLGGGQAIVPLNQSVNVTALSATSIPAVDTDGPSAARLAVAPESEPEPVATVDSTPPSTSSKSSAASAPTSTAPTSTAPTSSAATTPTADPTGDGLHPTVTSDGNKVTPGEVGSPAGGGGTTTTTTTTTTGTTAGVSPTVGAPEENPSSQGNAAA